MSHTSKSTLQLDRLASNMGKRSLVGFFSGFVATRRVSGDESRECNSTVLFARLYFLVTLCQIDVICG